MLGYNISFLHTELRFLNLLLCLNSVGAGNMLELSPLSHSRQDLLCLWAGDVAARRAHTVVAQSESAAGSFLPASATWAAWLPELPVSRPDWQPELSVWPRLSQTIADSLILSDTIAPLQPCRPADLQCSNDTCVTDLHHTNFQTWFI